MSNELETKIKERITMARRKRIFQKASAIARKFGESKEGNRTFRKEGLKIWYHIGRFGHVDVTIEHNSKLVFEGKSTPKNKSSEIEAYAPNSEWEKKLNKFYQPIHKEIQKKEKQKQDSLRKRFGLES